MDGEEIGLFSPGQNLIDSITYKLQTTDVSLGRKTDGSPEWAYYTEPTPGTSNSTISFIDIVKNVPDFSVAGGIYTSPVTIELSTIMGGTIRYTLDCSEPLSSSPVYSSPITADSTTIIRARIFKENLIPGRIVTHTYFINEEIDPGTLPVVSIASNHENFWDPVTGIYVQDFKPEWEVPINIELFENNGSDRAAFNMTAGTKVNGYRSWQLPQKMLGIYFRKQYGENKLEYPLFFDRNRASFKSFALRASGSDWSYTLLRDALIQHSTRPNMSVDLQGYRPCVVYINGLYMGIHNMRSKLDDDFIEKNYDLEPGTFDLIEYEYEIRAEAGNVIAFNELLALLSEDMSEQSNYNEVADKMNIENFTDYMITEIYDRNTSAYHNLRAWKPKESGKWKWIFIDLDRGFFSPHNYLISSFFNRENIPLDELMDNDGYRMYFGSRMADHLYTTFHSQRMKKLIDEYQQTIEDEMPDHIDRWLGTTSSYGNAMPSLDYWYDEVCNIKAFAETRPLYLLKDLQYYGFSETAELGIVVSPSQAGDIKINGVNVPESVWSGPYLQDLQTTLTAVEKPGYTFQGWAEATKNVIVAEESVWKYLDDGSDQGTAWRDTEFNDVSWKSGQAKLGYGEDDENTIVSYGGNSSNKYITTYFRHTFQISGEDTTDSKFMIYLLCDDGAVVYLNGQEIIQTNLCSDNTDYLTTAVYSVNSPLESLFTSFVIDESHLITGSNVLAVEIHQSSPGSSDLGFDLEMASYKKGTSDFLTTDKDYSYTLSNDLNLIAVYEPTGQCILPADITQNTTLNKSCSPYLAQGDVTIHENITLTVEPGVEIWMPVDASIFINGDINAVGTYNEPVIFKVNPSYSGMSWGALCFINTSAASNLTYVTIEDASKGPVPIRDVAAISAYNADLVLDHIILENVNHNPVAARYSDIILTNSSLHSKVTGDLINVKYGNATIENCVFRGNDQEDTDAIDYDDVAGGVIKNCKIYNFFGINSDAIDIGEKATNIQIDGLLVYNITDKGVSVGQKSTAKVQNSTFVNCNMGLALKDSCQVVIDHCTFYGNAIAIACYEKNPGSAGGNGVVTNSILSNCSDASYIVDSRSTANITYSLADNDLLPVHPSNLFSDPLFINPTGFNFRLKPESPCINAGSNKGIDENMGTLFHEYYGEPSLLFSGIFYNPQNDGTKTEFLTLYNPGLGIVNISGYKITQGINFTFPESTFIGPGHSYLLSKYPGISLPGVSCGNVSQWSEGSLANEGETIRLENQYGIVLDYVNYLADEPWPLIESADGVLFLKSSDLDNHFPDNWAVMPFGQIVVNIKDNYVLPLISIYPNPASDIIFIEAPEYSNYNIEVYAITGELVTNKQLDANGSASIDISSYNSSILIIKVGDITSKVVIIRP